jgi:iron complex outermembrane receptor protein
MKRSFSHIRHACSALAIAMVATGPVWAQSATDAGTQTNSNQLEDIVVTAQKRGQNLQEVPIAISAFSGETLANVGVTNALDVQKVDPALTISMGGGATAVPFMRGVGNPGGITVGNEASVPLYIDDVYYSRVSNAYLDLSAIDRVEVLKGPQGTLFGRNASGGLISIYTRTPDRDKVVAELTAGYANYDTISGKVYASTPLGEAAAIDFSFSGKDQRGGWGRNLFTGNKIWREDYISFRSKLVADLGENTHVTAIGWYVKQFTQQGSQYQRAEGFTGFVPLGLNPSLEPGDPLQNPALYPTSNQPLNAAQNGGFYNVNVNYDPSVKMKSWGASLKLEQELESIDLVSISSYRKADDAWLAAGNISPTPTLAYVLVPYQREITQEFQIKSKPASPFSWILGAYYFYSKSGYVPTQVYGDAICLSLGLGLGCGGTDLNNQNPASYIDIIGLQRINSYSTFGQATFPVLDDKTNITLGLRYTIDKVAGFGVTNATIAGLGTFPAGPEFNRKDTFKKLTYKVGIDHKFADAVLGYVTFSRGYKSGTFNTLPLDGPPTNPEVVQTYELGLKTDLFDKRVRLNLAVFQNDITDPQVQVIRFTNGIGSVVLTNADKARTKGIEFDGQAIVADGLTLRFAANYLDAKFIKYENAPYFFQLPAPYYGFGQCGAVFAPSLQPVAAAACPATLDANGNRMPQAPKFKGSAGFNYKMETGAGRVTFDGNVSYSTKFYWAPDNNFANRALAIFDGSIAFAPSFNEGLEFRVWGKNLTGKKYYQTILENLGTNTNSAAPAAPRQYGVEVSYKF